MRRLIKNSLIVLALSLAFGPAAAYAADKPNIVVIYADDMGYGDCTVNNPQSKIPTPHIDRLARKGSRFTDAHSPGSTCTASRYGLLTGTCPVRRGVVDGVTGLGPVIDRDVVRGSEAAPRPSVVVPEACPVFLHVIMVWFSLRASSRGYFIRPQMSSSRSCSTGSCSLSSARTNG